MKIIAAGQDISQDLGPALAHQASARTKASRVQERLLEQADVLTLKRAENSAAFLDIFTRLASSKAYVRPDTFPSPATQGRAAPLLKRVRNILWKLTRWQSDAMAAQQNAVNQHLASVLSFEKQEREREVNTLKARLDELESRDKTS